MPELTYAIGGIDIEQNRIAAGDTIDFVIGLDGNTASLYAGNCGSHAHLAKRFDLGIIDDKYRFVPAEGKRVNGNPYKKNQCKN